MHTVTRRPSTIKAIATVAIPVLALLTLFSWAFSSAPGSSPDDDFHLASIWCGLGDREGLCEIPNGDSESTARLVPTPITSVTCAAMDSAASADCWKSDATGLGIMPRANIDGLYPPIFYATMSLFVSPDVAASVLTVRIVNSTLTVGILTSVFFLLPRRLRPTLLLSVLATSVPLGLFVFASTNPSAWALLSAAVVWVAVYGALTTTSRARSIALTSFAILATVMGAGARADAALFAVFGAGIGLWLGIRRGRRTIIPLIGSVIIVAVSALLYLSASQSGAATSGLGGYGVLSAGDLMRNGLEIPSLWLGAFGSWPLGWFDTNMPTGVWALGFAVFSFVLISGVRGASVRRVVAYCGALVAMWFVPFFILAQSGAHVGQGVQPRYILPLLIIAVGVAAASELGLDPWRGWPMIVSALALTIANAVALQVNLRRYTTGLDKNNIDPGQDAEWWWTLAPSPLAIWVIGVVSFALLLAGLLLANRADEMDAPKQQSDSESRLDLPATEESAPDGEQAVDSSADSALSR